MKQLNQKSFLGKLGEDIAVNFIAEKGFSVVDRNYRRPWGEIDIIAKDNKGTLVFFEVKTMVLSLKSSLRPEDNLTRSKIERIKKTAKLYSGHNQHLIDDELGWRIDAITVAIEKDSLTKSEISFKVNYFEGIV